MLAITALEIASSIIVDASVPASFENHTFLIRTAPPQSRYAGEVCAEIRCPGDLKALDAVRQADVTISELERWVHPVKGWKLLRFTASPADLLKLHEVCNAPDIERLDIETQSHLATMSLSLASEALTSQSVKELRALAKSVGIAGVSRMKKIDLLAALTIPAVA